MFEIGRVCVKIAGRDAGKRCIIVEKKENFFLIDGETRRKKVNPLHLEPLDQILKIKEGADHAAVCKALGIDASSSKARKAKPAPKKLKKVTEGKSPQ